MQKPVETEIAIAPYYYLSFLQPQQHLYYDDLMPVFHAQKGIKRILRCCMRMLAKQRGEITKRADLHRLLFSPATAKGFEQIHSSVQLSLNDSNLCILCGQ